MSSGVNLRKMRLISYIWGAILVLIFVALTAFGFYFKHTTKVYKEFESDIASKTKEYIMENSMLYEGDIDYSFDELIEFGVLENKKVNEKDCDGYVTVAYENESYDYKTYLQCGMYKTKGYRK